MVNDLVTILGIIITLFGIFLSLIIACQFAYLGSVEEIIITGIIGLINLYGLYIFSKSKNYNKDNT
ncbi:hypothetical protein [Tepidibacter formicigenes]|uniref:Uncharacterized protein n=1 Tax=Tepidibacter formicigenes DSM 15518 TaxID=1123349 RepID=A0A1M6PYK8_9FIRM|nr:hypothetical protein [Tepidibacter formicigenes]SHK13020.1 hypothetical protein SAMN02744037_01690 [Tepidibacter formicigenes DSM 15518]